MNGTSKLGSCSSFPRLFGYKVIVTIINCFMPLTVLNMAESNLYSNTAGIIPILHVRKQAQRG